MFGVNSFEKVLRILISNYFYVSYIYNCFLVDPNSVDVSWRDIFEKFNLKDVDFYRLLKDDKVNNALVNDYNQKKDFSTNYDCLEQIKIFQFVDAYRNYGHRIANLDPLKLSVVDSISELDLNFYNFSDDSKTRSFFSGLFSHSSYMKLIDILHELKKIYCSSVGVEYMHISNIKEKLWIQQQVEFSYIGKVFSSEEKKCFLKEIIAAENIEQYLGMKFPGAKRFSLEGCEVLIPMLKELIRCSCNKNTKEIVIAMAHRGRLNVLVNVLGKSFKDLLDEFLGTVNNDFGSGDVKYHQGFISKYIYKKAEIYLSMLFNPSHLEIVNPVMMGYVRSKIDNYYSVRKRNNQSLINENVILPISIHGDASVVGQGVIQETLNLSQSKNYGVGGILHIVINNQIGFTTDVSDSRSTLYCTDIFKMLQIPIFHVNADDVESVIFVIRVAVDYLFLFRKDIVIDLVCYRRHGHNEVDDPNVTQPLMYSVIKNHPTLQEIYFKDLECKNIVSLDDKNKMIRSFQDLLDFNKGKSIISDVKVDRNALNSNVSKVYIDNFNNRVFFKDIKRVDGDVLKKIAKKISVIPNNIKVHPLVSKIYNDRLLMSDGRKLFDWGGAENLAYATILNDGISIRLSGEDVARGTFFHRHAVIYDQVNNSVYVPLSDINNKCKFYICNSVLSEEAVLAFEYGYSISNPGKILVIWEAQFGDFANGAQVVIDQFISSGKQKWGRYSNLVMLLPHGYEGQGPEHSSARLERYLQLCAENNIRVCFPTTPSQMYHILRYQSLSNVYSPLIIMTPKSLLRNSLVVSSLDEMSNGFFKPVIDEIDDLVVKNVKRVIMCSGKIYYDLLKKRLDNKDKYNDVAIVRIEQLYPFPAKEIWDIISCYKNANDLVWCQEEPRNQGAWCYIQCCFLKNFSYKFKLKYIGRSDASATSTGYFIVHNVQQDKLITDALNIN